MLKLKILFSRTLLLGAFLALSGATDLRAQAKPEMKKEEAPLRVALAGLVHGHAFGFFEQFQKRTDLQVVGIAEADGQLVAKFEKRRSEERRVGKECRSR